MTTAEEGANVGGWGRLTLDRVEVEGPPASAVPRGAGAACSAYNNLVTLLQQLYMTK